MQTSGTSITVPDSDFTTAAGGVTTYQYSISASSAWKSTSGGVGIIASGNPSWGRVTAVGGSGYYAFLQGGSASIYQTITGLSSGSTFVFSWYQQGRPNYGTNDLSVSVSTSVSGTYTELYYNNSVSAPSLPSGWRRFIPTGGRREGREPDRCPRRGLTPALAAFV